MCFESRTVGVRVPFDSVAKVYDKTRSLPERAMNQLCEALASEMSRSRLILDAGVGTGRFAGPLQARGFNVVGVDISRAMLGKAKQRDLSNLLLSDVCYVPFADNCFDAAICIHVLHLLREWKLALREMCRVTRRIMVSTIYEGENPIRNTYSRLLEEYGYKIRRHGKGEWELKDLVKPLKSVFVASFYREADERLFNLCKMVYSSQWGIPQGVNAKAVCELRKRFAGKRFRQKLHLLVWDIKDLKVVAN